MERKNFLKIAGLAGITPLLPVNNLFANDKVSVNTNACALIPSETAGPFPLDLTTNTFYFRQDVRESKAGVPLNLKLKIIGQSNCAPMQNVRVNIWHCDKDGAYSGYDLPSNPGQAGLTYLRGYQITDSNGEVNFVTIFPGWYPGRICHIHFQVYVSSSYSAISQLSFDLTAKNNLYTANSAIYTKGTDPLSFASDNVFADGYTYQVASLSSNTSGGYDSYIEVTVKGTGTTGTGNIEKQNAGNFILGQNYPNPYSDETAIPFSLKFPSDVKIELFDLSGRKAAELINKNLGAGDHKLTANLQLLNLAPANYVYQIEVKNSNGLFRDFKMMTLAKQNGNH